MIVAFDGGKRVGWCAFDEDGYEINRGVVLFEDFLTGLSVDKGLEATWLGSKGISNLVVEGFRHDPTVNQGGSLHWASQVEGAVKMIGAVTDTPVTVQYASILPVSMLHTGYEPPKTKTGNKKHLPDQDSAFLHAHYFLVGQGVL